MCDGLLSVRQVWQIAIPFEFTDDEGIFLLDNLIETPSDWYHNKYKPIKDRIREHYLTQQNCTCAYCRLPIHGGTDNVEIEHIVDKNNRLDFIMEPRNLVVSCHKCNFAKKTQHVLSECPPLDQYPDDGSTFEIIHGHYDDYFSCIEIKASTYHAINEKGEQTIITCGLDREGLAEQREEVEMYQDDPMVSAVLEFKKGEASKEELDDLINKIKEIQAGI